MTTMRADKARARLKKRPSEYMRDGDNFWVGVELGEKGLKYVSFLKTSSAAEIRGNRGISVHCRLI